MVNKLLGNRKTVHKTASLHKNTTVGGRGKWLKPVILATQEAAIRKIEIQS
jgi:hypothetical protein